MKREVAGYSREREREREEVGKKEWIRAELQEEEEDTFRERRESERSRPLVRAHGFCQVSLLGKKQLQSCTQVRRMKVRNERRCSDLQPVSPHPRESRGWFCLHALTSEKEKAERFFHSLSGPT